MGAKLAVEKKNIKKSSNTYNETKFEFRIKITQVLTQHNRENMS